MASQAIPSDAETSLSLQICKLCNVQPGCVVLGYSSSPPLLSKRNVRQNGRVCQLDFLAMLHEVILCSSLQKEC